MKKLLLSALILINLFNTVASAPVMASAKSEEPSHNKLLEQTLRELQSHGSLGVQIRLTDQDSIKVANGGKRQLYGAAIQGNERFRVASVTKLFTSVVILQLVAENKIKLDEPVHTYMPGLLPNGKAITIRMLLQQTTGLYDYADDLQRTPEEQVAQRFYNYHPLQLIGMSAKRPLTFEPGTRHEYTNINHVVLGFLIETVTKNSYKHEIEKRIIRPYRMDKTEVPGSSPFIRGVHSHSYAKLQNGKIVDLSIYNVSSSYSAGQIISSSKDLDKLLKALFYDRTLLPTNQLNEMKKTFNVPDNPDFLYKEYGHGLYPIKTQCGTKFWGHSGGDWGYATFAFTTDDGRSRVVISLTEGDKEMAYDLIYVTVNKLLSNLSCNTK